MPFYKFQHPNTKEIFEDFRMMKDSDLPFIAPDGLECPRISDFNFFTIVRKDAEFWDRFPGDVKESSPKFVRSRSGRRIRYDPTKHS